MRVLVACEFSGVVRDAFRAQGHDAVSCDLLPSDAPGPHMQGDVRDLLYGGDFDLMIAHPPCTHLAVSGARWFKAKARVHRMPPSPDRGKLRSITLPGIAAAMAAQWGTLTQERAA